MLDPDDFAFADEQEHVGWGGPEYEPTDSEIAESMMRCPWYLGVGTCDRGCVSEPACQTMEPTEGWASLIETTPEPPYRPARRTVDVELPDVIS